MKVSGTDRTLLSEINVTPFVDVMLVLLVIFMVTAPLIQTGISVNLPEAEAKTVVTKEDPLVISIEADGKIYIQDAPVPAGELGSKLQAIFENRKTREAFLRADQSVSYGVVVRALAEIKAVGIDRLGMITTSPKR